MIFRLFICAILQLCIIGFTSGLVPQITRLNVQCDRTGMKVMVEFDNAFNGIIFSKGHYSDPNCRYVNALSGRNIYEFFVSSTSCGTMSNELMVGTKGGEEIPQGFKNVIIIQNDPEYQEVWDSARRLSCDWVTRLEKTVTFAPFGVDMLGVKELRFPGDTVDCWMDIQRGHGPFSPTVGGVVPIGEKLTVVIYVRDNDSSFDVHVKDCYAYDTPDYRNPNAHAIKLTDENGCPLKEKLIQGFFRTRDVRNSGATIIAYGIINAFKFPEKMDVFLACNVEVCKGGCNENMCQPIVEVAGQDSAAANSIAGPGGASGTDVSTIDQSGSTDDTSDSSTETSTGGDGGGDDEENGGGGGGGDADAEKDSESSDDSSSDDSESNGDSESSSESSGGDEESTSEDSSSSSDDEEKTEDSGDDEEKAEDSNGDDEEKTEESNGDDEEKTEETNGDEEKTEDSNGDEESTDDSNGSEEKTEESNGDEESSNGDENGDEEKAEDSNGDEEKTEESNGDEESTNGDENGDEEKAEDSNGDEEKTEESNGDEEKTEESNGDEESSNGDENGDEEKSEDSNGDEEKTDESNGDEEEKTEETNGDEEKTEESNGDDEEKTEESNGDDESTNGESNGDDEESKDEESNGDDSSSTTSTAVAQVKGNRNNDDVQTKEGDEAEITNGDDDETEEERKKRKISASLKLKAKKSSKVLKAKKLKSSKVKKLDPSKKPKTKKPLSSAAKLVKKSKKSSSTAPAAALKKSPSKKGLIKKKKSAAVTAVAKKASNTKKVPKKSGKVVAKKSTTSAKLKKKSATRPATSAARKPAKLIKKPASRSVSSSARLVKKTKSNAKVGRASKAIVNRRTKAGQLKQAKRKPLTTAKAANRTVKAKSAKVKAKAQRSSKLIRQMRQAKRSVDGHHIPTATGVSIELRRLSAALQQPNVGIVQEGRHVRTRRSVLINDTTVMNATFAPMMHSIQIISPIEDFDEKELNAWEKLMQLEGSVEEITDKQTEEDDDDDVSSSISISKTSITDNGLVTFTEMNGQQSYCFSRVHLITASILLSSITVIISMILYMVCSYIYQRQNRQQMMINSNNMDCGLKKEKLSYFSYA